MNTTILAPVTPKNPITSKTVLTGIGFVLAGLVWIVNLLHDPTIAAGIPPTWVAEGLVGTGLLINLLRFVTNTPLKGGVLPTVAAIIPTVEPIVDDVAGVLVKRLNLSTKERDAALAAVNDTLDALQKAANNSTPYILSPAVNVLPTETIVTPMTPTQTDAINSPLVVTTTSSAG